MPAPHTTFPVAEGVGIFIGIVAWDLLTDGQLEVIKALIIAAPCALVWFGVRCWKDRTRNKQR
jgi:hypothetical protein